MPDGTGGGGEGAGGGTAGGVGSGPSGTGGEARGGMGFAGTGSGLAGSGTGAASTGMGGGTMGSTGSASRSPSSMEAIAKALGFVPGPVGMFAKGFSAISGLSNAFGGFTGTTGAGMTGDSSSGITSFGSGGPGNNLSDYLNIASGLYGAFSGSGSGTSAQNSADPFAPYRPGLAAQYAAALQPGAPSNIQAMPGYTQYSTGVVQPAMEQAQRTAAASGQLYSGGEQAQLQKIGQQGYFGFMTDYLNRLATGSGAGASPYNAASLGVTQQNLANKATMEGIGAAGQGIAGLFKGSAPTGYSTDYGQGTAPSTALPYDPSQYAPGGTYDPTLEWSM
jgi:hypothetical protein